MVNSRKKGNKAERDVIKILSKYFAGNFERRSMGMDGADVICSDAKFVYSVEIKNHKTVKAIHLLTGKNKMLNDWWKQAVKQSEKDGKRPLLVVKAERFWFCTEMAPEFSHWCQFELWCKHQI